MTLGWHYDLLVYVIAESLIEALELNQYSQDGRHDIFRMSKEFLVPHLLEQACAIAVYHHTVKVMDVTFFDVQQDSSHYALQLVIYFSVAL